jgi:hypothetical protein
MWIEWAEKQHKITLEMMRIWRERHPREEAAVREEATAIVEKRKPNFPPQEAFGAGQASPDRAP